MSQFSTSTTVTTRLQTVAHSGGVPWWKRALDVTLILLAMPILVPIGLFVAAIIKLVSPGPIFFQQERVGHRGQRGRGGGGRAGAGGAGAAGRRGRRGGGGAAGRPGAEL